MIDWNDLPYFLAVAKSGTLMGASKGLKVNHSTVFRRINAIEDKLGARLFERRIEGYELTQIGHTVLEYAQLAENSIHSLERAVAGKDYELSGEIRVTSPLSIAEHLLVPCVAKFRIDHPRISVNVIVSSALYDLSRRDADIAIRTTNNPPDYLLGRKVTDLTWSAYASKAYVKKNGAPIKTKDLSDYDLIGADESLLRIEAYKWLMRQYSMDNFSCFASDVKTISSLCDQDLGVAVLPTNYFNQNLVRLFDVEPKFKDGLWILMHPDLRQVARIKEFGKFLHQYMLQVSL
ncbi:MAG: LysR family transcriptional regulator [Gammaproteobacteria bacterium]